MKTHKIILLLIFSLFYYSTNAEEGMWLLPLLEKFNIEKMQKEGCKLSADDIYSINKNSLKDAVVMFGQWCTGVVISNEGLILTNHHCGYAQIQQNSSSTNNIIENGFWARSLEEEIPNPGLTVSFMIKMEDVTSKILPYLENEIDYKKRIIIKDSISKIIVSEAIKDTHYEGVVESFFSGNQYFLIIYETFKDVRLVGTPPASIGKFGDETDNWMWPRHTGDFCLFRIYADSIGRPADYSPSNIPFKPRHYLPISIKGVQEGDYAMIIGYPGRTMRYSLPIEVEELQNIINPALIQIRGEKLKIMKEAMQENKEIKLKLSAKYASASNYWKYAIGQNQGIRKNNIIERLKNREEIIIERLKNDSALLKEYIDLSNAYKNIFEKRMIIRKNYIYLLESLLRGSDLLNFAFENYSYFFNLYNNTAKLKSLSNNFYKDFVSEVDKKITENLINIYHKNVDKQYYLSFFDKNKKSFKNLIDKIYNKSIFSNLEKFENFISKPSKYNINKDPLYLMVEEIINLRYKMLDSIRYYNNILSELQRRYINIIMKVYPDSTFYPDANFTMRLTYGKVLGYSPADAIKFNYYTTVDGIIEKEDPENYEFIVPEKLKFLIKNKNFGKYSQNGVMPVCFISENDITGGNSGSPVIDGEGNLIGLAFDSNWESLTGEIIYDRKIKRSICVDSRYILFIIDKYADAQNVINEIKIVE